VNGGCINPESPCPYSAAFTATYQAVLAVNAAASVANAVVVILRFTVMKKRLWRKNGTWLKSIDAFELLFQAASHSHSVRILPFFQ